MSSRPTLVLIDLDAADIATFQDAALREHGARVILARTWPQALALVRTEHPELVVAGDASSADGASAACRGVHEAAGEHPLTLALVSSGAGATDPALPWNEAPRWVPHPVPAPAAQALIRGAVETRTALDALREARAQVLALTAALEREQDATTELLLRIVELKLPGAIERAQSRRELANELCERLGIPGELRRDLDLAVRLAELGRLVADAGSDAWRAAQFASSILASIPGCAGASELVAAQCENWDGTGTPGHRLQGQIPLRARILRVLADYVAARDNPTAAAGGVVLERIAERAGTWYDPMVVVHLRAIAGDRDGAQDTRVIMPAEDLQVGMVLAEDLCSDSGIKLLARGAEITPAALETILRRHRVEPLMHGAAVLRR